MEEKRPKVYIVADGGHDYSDAERFGDIVFLSTTPIHRHAVDNMVRTFNEILKKSSPEDYLLVTQYTNMVVVATAIMSHLHGKVRLILFDHNGRYLDRMVEL